MVRLPAKQSTNFEDRTGQSEMEGRVRQKLKKGELTWEEEEIMRENKWTKADMLILRTLKRVSTGKDPARLPDKHSPSNWQP